MAGMAPTNLSEHILMCGHAQKRAHSTSRWKSRFIVLTPSHLHWFKRQRGDETLFGSELGSVDLKAVSSASKAASEGGGGGWFYFTVEAIEEAGYATTPFLRNFRMEKKADRDAWVRVINQAMKGETPSSTLTQPFSSLHSVYPTMLTRGGRILKGLGELPVRAGWDSRGFECGEGCELWFANGQKVKVPASFDSGKEVISVPSPVPEPFINAAKERQVQHASIESVSFAGSKVSKPDAFAMAMLPASALFATMALYKTSPEIAAVVVIATVLLTAKAARSTEHVVQVVSLAMSKPEAIEEEEDSDDEEEQAIPPVPKRFIEGLKDQGGMPEALRRWKITASWRKEYNIDTILTKPLPEFRAVKESYPLYYHGLTKPVFPDGKGGLARHLVYIEAPAKCDMEKLSALGMESLKQFERFITEWVYTYLVPYECDKIFNVVDVEGFKLTELKGDRLEFFKFITSLSQDHYPERASVIAVVNAPSWFSMLFRLVKPMINENTQKKIRVYTAKETYAGLLEFLEPDRIPEEYGGSCSYKNSDGEKIDCWKGTEMERAMFDYVDRLNAGRPLPRPPHWNREDVLQAQKDLANNDEIWEGGKEGKGDPFYTSDVHLPLSEQKSKFALMAQGLLGEDGKPIWSVDDKTSSSSSSSSPPSLVSSSPSPSMVKSASANNISASTTTFIKPVGVRPHSTSANSSELEQGDKEDREAFDSSEGSSFKHVNIGRKDSTLDLSSSNRGLRHQYGDSEYGDSDSSDSDDDREGGYRLRSEKPANRTASAASVTSEGSGMFWNNNMPQPSKILHEGWIYKKATGEGFFGRRNWAPRWAKLVEATVPENLEIGQPYSSLITTEPVPMLMMYWYENSVAPSSFILLDDCVTVPVDRSAEEWNSHCFDIVHLPAKRQTRSFSALNASQRDEWVSKVNKLLSAHGRDTDGTSPTNITNSGD